MEYQTFKKRRLTKAGKIVIISVVIFLVIITFILSKDKFFGIHKNETYETAKEFTQKEKIEEKDKIGMNNKIAILTNVNKENKEEFNELKECEDILNKELFKGIDDMQMTVYQYENEKQENNENIKIVQKEPQTQNVEESENEKTTSKRELTRIIG